MLKRNEFSFHLTMPCSQWITCFHPFYFQDDEDSSSSSDESDAEPDPPVEPAQPRQPHVLAIAWSFFTTFFSSLIPQQPAAVNAN